MLTSLQLSAGQATVALGFAVALCGGCFFLTPQASWAPGALLSFSLCWSAAVDIQRQILPNIVTLGLVAGGLAYAGVESGSALIDRAVGALAGYLAVVSVRRLYAAARGREGIGLGDAKLFAAAGAWLGWQALPYVMLMAAASALVVVGLGAMVIQASWGRQRIPFGPFIAVGMWVFWVLEEGGFDRLAS